MNTEIELRHLRYFVAVAEELHFGRAAQRLHLAQPPLSQQIRKLEEILGYQLFERTSRSVALTAAGQVFLERAQRTLRNVSRDIDEARSIGRGEVGSLHIGFVGSAMLTTLPAIFRRYREAYPLVRLHLHESFTSKVIDGLQNGTLDAGLLRDGDPTEGLSSHTIYTEPFVAVLPAHHPRAKQRTIAAADLRGEPFVYYPRSAGSRAFDKPLSLFDEYGYRPQIVQEASHWLSILRLIGAGLGVSIAPACVRHITSPEIVCLPIRTGKKQCRGHQQHRACHAYRGVTPHRRPVHTDRRTDHARDRRTQIAKPPGTSVQQPVRHHAAIRAKLNLQCVPAQHPASASPPCSARPSPTRRATCAAASKM